MGGAKPQTPFPSPPFYYFLYNLYTYETNEVKGPDGFYTHWAAFNGLARPSNERFPPSIRCFSSSRTASSSDHPLAAASLTTSSITTFRVEKSCRSLRRRHRGPQRLSSSSTEGINASP